MAFPKTPQRTNPPSQLLPLASILGSMNNAPIGGTSSSIAFTSLAASATEGYSMSLVGTVSPSGAAVQVGLSGSMANAPTNWLDATVIGTGWTASLTPSAAGTYYIWAEQTSATNIYVVSAAVTVASSGSSESLTIANPPTGGTVGTALSVAGTVAPNGAGVRLGLTASASVAPTSWVNAVVSGAGWSATITPSAAGTYYIWAEQTATPSVTAVSAAVTVVAAAGSPLTYSLISGSGNGSLNGTTLSNTTYLTADWTTVIEHGATDVAPNVQPSAMGSIASSKFWFDTSATAVTVPSSNYGNNASVNNGVISFYPNSYFTPPTGIPAAPAIVGTYYGKYAMYDSGSVLLGIYVTSAITVI